MVVARVGQPVKDAKFLHGVHRTGSDLTIALRHMAPFSSVVVGTNYLGDLSVKGFGGRNPQFRVDSNFHGIRLSDALHVFAATRDRTLPGSEYLLYDPERGALLTPQMVTDGSRARHIRTPHETERAERDPTANHGVRFWSESLRGKVEHSVSVNVIGTIEEATMVVRRDYHAWQTEREVHEVIFTNIGIYSVAPPQAQS
jgi:hypothetical protein